MNIKGCSVELSGPNPLLRLVSSFFNWLITDSEDRIKSLKILWNQLFRNSFCKNVTSTKFLSKCVRVNFCFIFPHCDLTTKLKDNMIVLVRWNIDQCLAKWQFNIFVIFTFRIVWKSLISTFSSKNSVKSIYSKIVKRKSWFHFFLSKNITRGNIQSTTEPCGNSRMISCHLKLISRKNWVAEKC